MRPLLTPRNSAQVVAYTASSAQSAAFATGTKVIRVCPTSSAWVVIGANPTADKTVGIYIAAGTPVWFGVKAGEKIAALQDSAGGNLSVVESGAAY